MKIKKLKFASVFLATSLLVTPILGIVQNNQNIAEATYTSYNNNINKNETLNDYEIQQLAKDLEFFFTKVAYEENGRFIINKEEAKKIQGMNDEIIKELNTLATKINNQMYYRSWLVCVKDRIMDEIGEVVHLGAAGAALIERKAWLELAQFLAKRVSKQALKRSPWVMAGVFAWHSARCIGH